mmetsp:Transcript_2594/g.5054  ORF Transcript_2594/g.5054 Transcript_2594/m.5054 type:complete len:209 (-) Transcript_2594:491-1117(-)
MIGVSSDKRELAPARHRSVAFRHCTRAFTASSVCLNWSAARASSSQVEARSRQVPLSEPSSRSRASRSSPPPATAPAAEPSAARFREASVSCGMSRTTESRSRMYSCLKTLPMTSPSKPLPAGTKAAVAKSDSCDESRCRSSGSVGTDPALRQRSAESAGKVDSRLATKASLTSAEACRRASSSVQAPRPARMASSRLRRDAERLLYA